MRYQKITLLALAVMLLSAPIFAQPDVDPGRLKDQKINDDLIVCGSECVGLDCVNGMNFGFDTQVYKENNLRVFFDDTSTSASFPTNNWRIVINDSSNGGGNYFAVEDASASRQVFRVEAGARANALYVESDGDIGIGTNNPAVDIDIKTGNTPTVRLQQDATSGFTPQTWDLAGNETNFFIRDATNGSTLPLRIRPGAKSSAIDVLGDSDIGIGTSSPDAKFHIDTDGGEDAFLINNDGGTAAEELFVVKEDGKVGIGTVSPTYKLHIKDDANNARIQLESTSGSGIVHLRMKTNDDNQRRIVGENTAGVQSQISLRDNGLIRFFGPTASPTWNIDVINGTSMASSRSLKSKINNLKVDNILERIAAVPVTTYHWKEEHVGAELAKNEVMGLIAQDFHTVFGRGSDEEIRHREVRMALWLGVQELHKNNKQLESLMEEKESRIAELEDHVQELSKGMDEILELLKNNQQDIFLRGNGKAMIGQNHPNPYLNETVIEYFIPDNTQSAEIQVLDIKGQLIKKTTIQSFGKGQITFKASELPHGSYNYSLIINGEIVDTKQMILAK